MTASSVTVPTTTTSELATDEVDDRHFQGVKVYGGGEGVVNELLVTSTGSVRTVGKTAGFFSPTSIGETSYADKACIGGAIVAGSFPPGLYTLVRIGLLMVDFGTPAPATDPLPDMKIGLVGVPTGTDVSSVVDGFDLTTLPLEFMGSVQFVDSPLVENPLLPSGALVFPESPLFLDAGSEPTADLIVLLMADGPVSTDLTAWGLAVAGLLEVRATAA